MDDINAVFGRNLRNFREGKKLSLDKVAELTGVSKAMLGQIERGESSPTITTVWKIAKGLKISFTSLLQKTQDDTFIVSKKDTNPLLEDEGRYRVYPYFPIEADRPFELYSVELDEDALLHADPHMEGTQEFITVYDGELTMIVNQQTYVIASGDSIRFRADVPHVYQNTGNTMVRMSMAIYYSK